MIDGTSYGFLKSQSHQHAVSDKRQNHIKAGHQIRCTDNVSAYGEAYKKHILSAEVPDNCMFQSVVGQEKMQCCYKVDRSAGWPVRIDTFRQFDNVVPKENFFESLEKYMRKSDDDH